MSFYLILYFLAGVLQDFLVTLNWRFASKEKILASVTFSFLATIISFTVLYNIVINLNHSKSIVAIIACSIG